MSRSQQAEQDTNDAPKRTQRRSGGRAARLAALPSQEEIDLVKRGSPNYTAAPSPEKICIIACGALAKEILDVVEVNGLSHISLTCLPAILHNSPEKIPDEIERSIGEARKAGFEQIYIGYADCGTGGKLDAVLEKEKVERLPGAHCYAFFTGVEAFEKSEEFRAFYLTDFLARHFENLTWRSLGLDRHPELLEDYFGHYDKVIYLAQTENEKLLDYAKRAAELMQLPLHIVQTGYGDLSTSLSEI